MPGSAADAAATSAAWEPGQPAQQQQQAGAQDAHPEQQQVVAVVRHVLSAELLLYLDRVTQLLRGGPARAGTSHPCLKVPVLLSLETSVAS